MTRDTRRCEVCGSKRLQSPGLGALLSGWAAHPCRFPPILATLLVAQKCDD
jgi:hypothetical protein